MQVVAGCVYNKDADVDDIIHILQTQMISYRKVLFIFLMKY